VEDKADGGKKNGREGLYVDVNAGAGGGYEVGFVDVVGRT